MDQSDVGVPPVQPEPESEARGPARKRAPRSQRPAANGQHTTAVFVRVRPLLKHLGEAGASALPGLCTHAAGRGIDGGSTKGGVVALAVEGNGVGIGGFTGILGAEEGNASVFERAFRPCVSTVVGGGTAALFCYGESHRAFTQQLLLMVY